MDIESIFVSGKLLVREMIIELLGEELGDISSVEVHITDLTSIGNDHNVGNDVPVDLSTTQVEKNLSTDIVNDFERGVALVLYVGAVHGITGQLELLFENKFDLDKIRDGHWYDYIVRNQLIDDLDPDLVETIVDMNYKNVMMSGHGLLFFFN